MYILFRKEWIMVNISFPMVIPGVSLSRPILAERKKTQKMKALEVIKRSIILLEFSSFKILIEEI